MAALVTAEANRLLDASLAVATYTAPTGSMKIALATSASSASAAGTEVSGGSYARQNVTFGSASSGSSANSGAVNFTNMPAATVTHLDIYDSNGTPRRAWYGPLSASKTTASGDTLSFAVSAVSISLS
jgi:hypothetical protein